MQKQLNKLKQHLRICKLIILVLICVIVLQAMPNEVEILNSSIDLDNDLRIEAHKLHQLEEYKNELKENRNK